MNLKEEIELNEARIESLKKIMEIQINTKLLKKYGVKVMLS